MTARRAAFLAGCLAAQFAGALGGFYMYFLATQDPASWLAQHTRPH